MEERIKARIAELREELGKASQARAQAEEQVEGFKAAQLRLQGGILGLQELLKPAPAGPVPVPNPDEEPADEAEA